MLLEPRRGRELGPLGEEFRVRQSVQRGCRFPDAPRQLIDLSPVRAQLLDFVSISGLPPHIHEVQFTLLKLARESKRVLNQLLGPDVLRMPAAIAYCLELIHLYEMEYGAAR